jgi:hypothetical protein
VVPPITEQIQEKKIEAAMQAAADIVTRYDSISRVLSSTIDSIAKAHSITNESQTKVVANEAKAKQSIVNGNVNDNEDMLVDAHVIVDFNAKR